MADQGTIQTVVWGTGNVGRAAIRAVDAHPGLELAAVIVAQPRQGRPRRRRPGRRSTAPSASPPPTTSTPCSPRARAPSSTRPRATSGPTTPLADIVPGPRAPAPWSSPRRSTRSTTRPTPRPSCATRCWRPAQGGRRRRCSSPASTRAGATTSCPILISGLAGTIDQIRCQEIFDYSTYDQPDSVRYLIGMGQPMDYEPPMVAPTVPTMVWGGQIRLIARALGVELDEIRETLAAPRARGDGRPNEMGDVRGRHPGRRCASRCRASSTASRVIVVEHITRIHPSCAPDWPIARPTAATAPTGSSSRAAPASRSPSRPPTRAATAPPAATPPRSAGWSTPSRGCAPPAPASTTPSTSRSPPPSASSAEGPSDRPGHPRAIDHRHRRSPRASTRSCTCGARWCPASAPPPPPSPRRSTSDTTLGLREFEAARLRIAADQRLPVLPGLAHRAGRREGRGHASPQAVEDVAHHRRVRRPHPARRRVRRALRPRPPRPRRRVLGPDDRALRPARDRRAEHVPRLVAGVRPPQPRARPRQRLRAARPLIEEDDIGGVSVPVIVTE